MNNYTIDQLINLQQVQSLLEAHVNITGIPCGLMDNADNIIVGAGLKEVWTAFHWEHPVAFTHCRRNDPETKRELHAFSGDRFECRCKNGMVNIAIPIIIEGERLGVFFSGQFFYDDEPPDPARFRQQAEELGFDPEAYLAAVRQAPLFSRSHVENTMGFLHQLVQMLTETGHANLRREQELEECKQREEQFKLFNFAFEHIREGAFLIELNQGKFLQVNQEACRSLEYSRDELIGMSALDIDPNFSTESLQDNIAELLTKGTITFETDHRTKSGKVFPVELTATIFEYNDAYYSLSLVRNISERKQMEQQLQQQIAFQQTLLDRIAMVGIQVMIIENGRIIYVGNRDLAYGFGYTDAELDAHPPFIEIVHPDERERIMDYHRRRLAGEAAPTTYEIGLVSKTGERRDYETAVITLPDTDPVRIITVGKDITERKQTEQQIKLLNHALDNLHDGAFLFDLHCRFIYVNQAACRSLGYDRDELLGMTVPDIDPDFSAIRTEEHLAELFEAQSLTFETRHRTRSGETFPVEINNSTFEYDGVRYFLALVRNITERKRAEQVAQTRLRMLETISQPEISRQDCLRLMLDEIEALTNSSIAFYHFLEADQQTLSLQAWSGNTVKTGCKAEGMGRHYPVAQAGVWADAIRERKPVIHNDYATLPNRKGMPEDHAEVIRELVVPIFRGGSIVAVIGVGNKPTDYTEADLQAVALLGDFSWEIATRTLAEDRIKLREQEFRSLAENSPDFIIRYDLEHRILYLNNGLVQLLGLAGAGEVIGKQPISIWPDGRFAAIDEGAHRAIRTGEAQSVELTWERNGQAVFHQILVVPEYDVGGRIIGTLAFGREITGLKQTEEQLKSREREFRTLAENSPDHIVRYDTQCRMVYLNPRLEKTLGIPAADLLGKTPTERPQGTERATYQERIRQVLATGDEAEIDLILPNNGEGERYHNIRFVAERDDDGTVVGVLAIGRDITERKQAEEEIRILNQELEERVQERTVELEQANARLQELDRMKNIFIASMSHELRTPLNSAIGFTRILLEEWAGPLNGNQKEHLAVILKSSKHLLALINDMIDVSTIEAGRIAASVSEFDVHDLVAEAALSCETVAGNKDIAIRVQTVHQTMCTDRTRLLQCLLNLATNAAKYTEQGSITIGAKVTDDGAYLELSVEDSGIGISEEDLARLFSPFIRLDSQLTSTVPGTGLGLYLTRKLATEVLQGDITVTSAPGVGSRFVLSVPINL